MEFAARFSKPDCGSGEVEAKRNSRRLENRLPRQSYVGKLPGVYAESHRASWINTSNQGWKSQTIQRLCIARDLRNYRIVIKRLLSHCCLTVPSYR